MLPLQDLSSLHCCVCTDSSCLHQETTYLHTYVYMSHHPQGMLADLVKSIRCADEFPDMHMTNLSQKWPCVPTKTEDMSTNPGKDYYSNERPLINNPQSFIDQVKKKPTCNRIVRNAHVSQLWGVMPHSVTVTGMWCKLKASGQYKRHLQVEMACDYKLEADVYIMQTWSNVIAPIGSCAYPLRNPFPRPPSKQQQSNWPGFQRRSRSP